MRWTSMNSNGADDLKLPLRLASWRRAFPSQEDRSHAVNVLDPGGVGGHGLGADTVDEPVVPWLRQPVP